MTIKDTKASLAGLKEQRKALKDQIRKQAEVAFAEASKELFESNPNLKAFSWAQYTPYFNDGDECVFSAHTGDPKIQYGDDEELNDWYLSDTKYVPDGYEYYKTWRGIEERKVKYKTVKAEHTPEELEKNRVYEAIKDFLSNFDDDELKMMFGDHVEIVVTPEGVSNDECSHD